MAVAAKQAGATYFGAGVLFLKPSSAKVFLPFLSKQFPQHLTRYRKSYASGAYLHGAYPDRIAHMIQSLRKDLGILSRDLTFHELPAPAPSADGQLRLF